MRKILALLLMLIASPALGQSFPPNMPANSVWGRLGIGAGPGQAIPFTTLAPRLNAAFLDTANIWSQPQTFRNIIINPPAASAVQGIIVNQSGPTSGTTAGTSTTCTNAGGYTLVYNSVCMTGEASNVTGVSGTKTAVLFSVGMVTGGANSDGSKVAFTTQVLHNQNSNITAGNDLQGSGFACVSSASQGGTDTGGGAKGTCFGTSSYGILQSGALNHFLVSSGEFGAQIQAGASARYRFAASFVDNSTLAAASLDAAIEIGSTTGSPGWKTAAILLTDIHGRIPLATTACLICYSGAAMTIATGVIASNITISGLFLEGPASAFSVTGLGYITGIGVTINNGTVNSHVSPSTLFTNSLEVGTVSNHNVVFIQNNTLAGYFDTGQKFNLGFASISQGAIIFHGLTAGTLEMAVPANFTAGRKITWPDGTTDFSATGGTSQVIKQITAGAALTVARLACADLSDAGAGCSTNAVGTVTSVGTTGPITGGTITTTGTIACATCVTSAAALTANQLVIGAGLQASAVTTTGTGVLTALGINVGSAGAFVTFNGAGGTPSSLVGTNITGTAAGLTAGLVTTNANLSGPITSLGNTTSINSQTGTGSTFVMQASPTINTLLTVAAAAGAVTGFKFQAGGNTSGDTAALDSTSLAGTVVMRQYSDAAGGTSRIKALGNLALHAGDIGFTATGLAILINGTNQNVALSSTTDATSTSTGALQVPGGMSVNKRVFMNAITTSSGLQTAVICQSSAGELIADSVACLASSARFKENLAPMADATALAEVMQLRPHTGHYKPEGMFANQRERVWFIAEQVAEIDTRLVGYDNAGLVRSVDYTGATVLNTGAIRALKADNDNLRAANDNLVTRVQELEARSR